MSITSISLVRGNYYLDCNSKVTNSYVSNSTITTSSIDMNGGSIKNIGTPIQPTDSVNKAYVDNAVGNVTSAIQVTLTGTNWSDVITSTSGSVNFVVKNIVANGPSASFSISKNSSIINGNPNRTVSCAGIGTLERLDIQWLASGPLQIRKTGMNYDGVYNIIIVYV